MKLIAFLRTLAAAFALCTATVALAQTAALTADRTALAAAGGHVQFTATVSYDGQPAALAADLLIPRNQPEPAIS